MTRDAHAVAPPNLLTTPLVAAFESATIDPATFRHRQHLEVAWCYLRSMPLEDAIQRYLHHLKKLVTALGAAQKFHATMTWAYLVLLNDVMHRTSCETFDALVARHPELLDHQRGILYAHYHRTQLESDEARQRFVLPKEVR